MFCTSHHIQKMACTFLGRFQPKFAINVFILYISFGTIFLFCGGCYGSCAVAGNDRRDCGWSGIKPKQCEDRGCCFDSSIRGVPWCFFGKQKDDECRNIVFKKPVANKAMKNHVISSEEVFNEGSCRLLCYMEPSCVSINLGPLVEGKHKCELSKTTDENYLESRKAFTYLAIEEL